MKMGTLPFSPAFQYFARAAETTISMQPAYSFWNSEKKGNVPFFGFDS